MHEWALAQAVLEACEKEGRRQNFKRLTKITVVLGELQAIDREIVEFAINNLKKGTLAEGAEFLFQEEKARFRCRNCGREWDLSERKIEDEQTRELIHFVPEVSRSFMRCPQCGSPDFEVIQGRGVYIKEMEGED